MYCTVISQGFLCNHEWRVLFEFWFLVTINKVSPAFLHRSLRDIFLSFWQIPVHEMPDYAVNTDLNLWVARLFPNVAQLFLHSYKHRMSAVTSWFIHFSEPIRCQSINCLILSSCLKFHLITGKQAFLHSVRAGRPERVTTHCHGCFWSTALILVTQLLLVSPLSHFFRPTVLWVSNII